MDTNSLAIVRSRSPIPIPLVSIEQRLSPPNNRLSIDTDKPYHDEGPVPIPWKSYIPILIFCVADAMSYSVIFPFITDMITSFDVPPDKIGLYSGLGEGIMMLVEAVNATNWAKLGDRFGRRPCIIIGFSVTVAALPFLAFSRSVWQIVLARAVMGLNPGGVLVKTSAAELAHPSNRDRIFSILSPSFSLGFLIGTFLGGELAKPYDRLPWWLGGTSEIWRRSPYALPCLVVCAFDLFAITFSILRLPETRKGSKSERAQGVGNDQVMRTLKVPFFGLITAVACLFQLCYFNWDGIFTIFTYTAPDKGGLGMPVNIIGLLYSAESIISIISNPLCLPYLQKSLGPRRALSLVLTAWPILALCMPLAQWTAVHGRWLMWIVVVVMMSLRTAGNFAWAMTDIMTIAAFDDFPKLMATGNAISLIAGAGGRAFGPAISGWIYSISTQFQTGSLGRQSSWVYLCAATLPGVILVRFLPRDSPKKEKDEFEAMPLVEDSA